MNFSSLVQNIGHKLKLHNSRIQTLTEMTLGLIDQHNVQHHSLVQSLTPKSSLKSKLERERRFLKEQDIPEIPFAKALISSVWRKIPKMHLMLDPIN